jgi:hypothetical protein
MKFEHDTLIAALTHMITPELLSYIREQLKAGSVRDTITQSLTASGWKAEDINAAFISLGVAAESAAPAQPAAPQEIHYPPVVAPATSAAAEPAASPVTAQPAQSARPRRSFARIFFITLIILVVLGIAGGVAYAFFEKLGPFANPPYTEKNFSSGILAKIANIQTSTYLASASLAVAPRDADAKPFSFEPTNRAQTALLYTRDSTRANDISYILRQLRNGKTYPASLAELVKNAPTYMTTPPSANDPQTHLPYAYSITEGGKNFNLSVTFETNDAVASIEHSYDFSTTSTSVVGQTVTFSKESDAYLSVPSTPPDPLFVQLQDMANYLPAQLSASFSVGATTDWSQKDRADWKFNVDATGDFGDLTYKVDADALKKDSVYYFRINNIPSILGDLSSYKGIWVKVDTATSSSNDFLGGNDLSYLASGLPDAEASYKKERGAVADLLKSAASIADGVSLIRFKNPPRSEQVDGRQFYRYDLAINKDAIVPFYTQVIAEAKKNPQLSSDPLLADEGLLDYLRSPEFDAVFAYYDANTTLTAWVDPAGFPSIVEYGLRFVPADSATALKDKQARLTFKLSLSDIDKPVTIEAPVDAKDLKELESTGPLAAAREKGKDAAVQSNLSTIQTQAEIYYSDTGNNSYGSPSASCTGAGSLFADKVIAQAIESVKESASGGTVTCNSTRTAYAVQTMLNAPQSTSTPYWCIDSSGATKASSAVLGKATKCP